MRRLGIAFIGLVVSNLLVACLWEDDSPAYPPLDKVKLVGCWSRLTSDGANGPCEERCFSAKGIYFTKSLDHRTDKNVQFTESGGTYTVEGNTVTTWVRIGNNLVTPDTTIIKIQDEYAIMRDTLNSITNNGSDLIPFVRADSLNTCGPHWQVFPRPDGWELN